MLRYQVLTPFRRLPFPAPPCNSVIIWLTIDFHSLPYAVEVTDCITDNFYLIETS